MADGAVPLAERGVLMLRDWSSPLTLGDLLREDDLGLELVVGGERALGRPIAGAHSIDVPHPASWLDRDWLVLMNGLNLLYEPASVSAMFDELVEIRASAIGFGVQPFFDRVPDEIISGAEQHDLPVISVPARTPFRQIVERVFRATLSKDVRASQRLIAVQRYLMDALGDELPPRSAIDRLAALVHGVVALLTLDGQIDLSTGSVPVDAIWQFVCSRPVTTLLVEVEGTQWFAVPVLGRGGVLHRWLVVEVDRIPGSLQLVKAAAQTLVPLLTAIVRLESSRCGQHRALHQVVLERLLEGDDDPLVAAQLRELGFKPGLATTLIVIVPSARSENAAGELLAVLDEELSHLGVALVAGVRRERVVAVVQPRSANGLHGVTEAISDLAVCAVGVGTALDALTEIPRGLRQAELAADSACQDPDHVVRTFAELGPTDTVLADLPLAGVRGYANELLAELRTHRALVETLRTFFEHRMSIVATSQTLHLHQNSLRYRLAQIEKIVGRPLRDPATIAALYIMLSADNGTEESLTPHDNAATDE